MKVRVSNTNQRANAGDRKAVLKSVLDSPFKVQWPYVAYNIQQITLASLVTVLAGVGAYQLERRSAAGKRKRVEGSKVRKQKADGAKRRKVGDDEAIMAVHNNDVGSAPQDAVEHGNIVMEVDAKSDIELASAPPNFPHLTCGINEVTRRLESQAHSRRLRTSVLASTQDPAENSPSASKPNPLAYVFVCRADIDPPLLVAHLPELVAACNAPLPGVNSPPVHLITLPKQAESTLAETVGLRRISVLALDSAAPSLSVFSSLLADVQPPSASWLTGPAPHIPTHIKQLRTTAPRDMRTAKQTRSEGRSAAKEKNKLKFGTRNKSRSKKTNKEVLVKSVTKVKTKSSRKRIKVVSSKTAAMQGLLPK